MQDKIIPRNEPGVAGFASESYGNNEEPRFGDGVAETIDVEVTNGSGAAITLPLYTPVFYDRAAKTLAQATVTGGESNANALTSQPINIAPGVTSRVSVYVGGHWSMDALNWHASFATQSLKEGAFEKNRPTLLVSKKKFSQDAIDIPN